MALPTVTTQAATNIATTSADGNGNITDIPGGNYDIDNASFSQSISTQESAFPNGIAWNDDGTKLYEVGNDGSIAGTTDRIYEYDVSTPFDISTRTFSAERPTEDSLPQGIAWNDDGTKLYEIGSNGDLIYESDLSTAFDITTKTFSQSIPAQDQVPTGITWNSDGTKLYEIGRIGASIYEYDVSTAYDISTATYSQSISTQDANPRGMAWNSDGTKLYEVGLDSDLIYEYDVSTAYDISTATFSKSISTQDASPQEITWNNDGSKLYEVGSGSDLIYEYDVSGTASERGFVYSTTTQTDPGNTSPAASAYESVENETGTFSTGTFSLSLTSLTKNTTYYVRAYAENSEGFSYGDEVEFTTLEQKPQLKGITQITGATQINF